MKIAHLSSTKRSNGDMTGVPKFAWYLQRAIGCDILTPGEKDLREYDILIGDGYNIPSQPLRDGQKLVSMVHGTYARWHNNVAINGEKIGWVQGEIVRQHNTWTNPNIHVVACSYADKKYVKQYHGRDVDTVILHGIYSELFKPNNNKYSERMISANPELWKILVIHTATNHCKTAHGKIDKIGEELIKRGYRFEFMNRFDGTENERLQEADIFLSCSLHEGNAYGHLEAMSCNLPLVVSRTGLFEDTNFDGYNIGEILDINASVDEYVMAIDKVSKDMSQYNPRKWILDNATFEIFSSRWNDYLKSL